MNVSVAVGGILETYPATGLFLVPEKAGEGAPGD